MIYPKRRKAPRLNVRKRPQVRSPKHRQWVRGFQCSVEGRGLVSRGEMHKCVGKIQAAHVRTGTDGGTGVKPSDFWAIPLCVSAHTIQHAIGERAFEQRYGIDMRSITEGLERRSPHRKEWSE